MAILMLSFPDPVCHMDAETLTLEQGRRFHNGGYELESLAASAGYTAGVGYFEKYTELKCDYLFVLFSCFLLTAILFQMPESQKT